MKLFSEILICDDHPIVQVGVEYSLKEILAQDSFRIRKVSTGQEAIRSFEQRNPDLFILDLNLPDFSGIELLRKIKTQGNVVKILILTSEQNAHILSQVLGLSVHAILLKSYSPDLFKSAIHYLASDSNDGIFIDETLRHHIKAQAKDSRITQREFEVLQLLLDGMTNREIAEKLSCSPETIKVHRSSISRKTQTKNRSELVSWFYRGILK